jgi:D-methionine transport system ATP-binding protein
MAYAIYANNLIKSYGAFTALNSVNLKIKEGSIFGLIGTSGAGKTTLLKILSTLETADSGELCFFDQKLNFNNEKSLKTLRSTFGIVFQNYQLLNACDVFENIALPLKLKKETSDLIVAKVDEILKLVGLYHKKHTYPSQLSGGQKQRVAIARALITEPKILLCDEPTAALDPENTHGILELLKKINKLNKTTIVIISHEIGLMGSICDEIAIMDHGQIVETGHIEEIFFNPKNAATQKLLHPKPAKIEHFSDLIDLSLHRLFQLKFTGNSAKSPVVSELASRFDLHLNILQGTIDKVGSSNLGHLVVSIPKDHKNFEQALNFLSSQQVSLIEL